MIYVVPIVVLQLFVALLAAYGFSDSQAAELLGVYREERRDIVFLTGALAEIAKNDEIKNRKSYLKKVIKNGKFAVPGEKKNRFANFQEHGYDYGEIQRKLISSV